MDRIIFLGASIIVAALIIASSIWMTIQSNKIVTTTTITKTKVLMVTRTISSCPSDIDSDQGLTITISSGFMITAGIGLWNNTLNKWIVVVIVKNLDNKPITVDKVLVDGKPKAFFYTFEGNQILVEGIVVKGLKNPIEKWNKVDHITVNPSETISIAVLLDEEKYSHGQIVQIAIHTTNGNKYFKLVTLP